MVIDDLPYPLRLWVRQRGYLFAWWMYSPEQLRRTLLDADPPVRFKVVGLEVNGVIVPYW
ncbi:hypothetical protein Deipe_3761 [Deinococcus peraridilitoris DSM 19664]|uniref:Uncharacterized protein n=1 Tax=Deinococcus peraridilitoris (strain DSM 19664 / LMG 22246 / CIP 109416 / KR-200) TaxID=937777 RepID=L0A5R5_DEIPD|nr:hypothetical protein Deipe_3761 [Deinococcus peraridilitoris DSM 19664]